MGRALKQIKEQLHAIPGHGLGYGLLRYLNSDTAARLDGVCRAANRLQLPGPLRGRSGRRRLGAGPRARTEPDDARGGAAAIRRCRWRIVIEINALTLG